MSAIIMIGLVYLLIYCAIELQDAAEDRKRIGRKGV